MNESSRLTFCPRCGVAEFAAVGLAVTVLVGLVGLVGVRMSTPQTVKSMALISVTPPAATDETSALRSNGFYNPILLTLARMATSDAVLSDVAAKRKTEVIEIQSRTAVRVLSGTMLIEIRYTDPTESGSKATLDDIVKALQAEAVKPAYQTMTGGVTLTVTQPPTVNIDATGTSEAEAAQASAAAKGSLIKVALIGGVAILLGLGTAIGLAAWSRRRKPSGGSVE